MNREQTITKMLKMAVAITGKCSDDWTLDKETEIWNTCLDWNAEHEDEEIFMCEYQTDDSEFVNGFMIEDDYFIVEAI
jgi:hypothetical protein